MQDRKCFYVYCKRFISHHSFSRLKSDSKHVYFSLFLNYFICTYVVSVDVHTYKAGNKQ